MAIPARPARGRKTIKRGAGKRIVEGKSFRLADEVRYIERRAADYDSRIVTIGQLILFSTHPAMPGCSTPPISSPQGWPERATGNVATSRKRNTRPPWFVRADSRLETRGR